MKGRRNDETEHLGGPSGALMLHEDERHWLKDRLISSHQKIWKRVCYGIVSITVFLATSSGAYDVQYCS